MALEFRRVTIDYNVYDEGEYIGMVRWLSSSFGARWEVADPPFDTVWKTGTDDSWSTRQGAAEWLLDRKRGQE